MQKLWEARRLRRHQRRRSSLRSLSKSTQLAPEYSAGPSSATIGLLGSVMRVKVWARANGAAQNQNKHDGNPIAKPRGRALYLRKRKRAAAKDENRIMLFLLKRWCHCSIKHRLHCGSKERGKTIHRLLLPVIILSLGFRLISIKRINEKLRQVNIPQCRYF